MTKHAKKLIIALLSDQRFDSAAEWSFEFMGIRLTAKRISDGD